MSFTPVEIATEVNLDTGRKFTTAFGDFQYAKIASTLQTDETVLKIQALSSINDLLKRPENVEKVFTYGN